jgi:hypothetical protein
MILMSFERKLFMCKCQIRMLLQIIHAVLVKERGGATLRVLSIFFPSTFLTFGFFSFYQTHVISFIVISKVYLICRDNAQLSSYYKHHSLFVFVNILVVEQLAIQVDNHSQY